MTPYHSGRQEYGFLWKKIKRLNWAFLLFSLLQIEHGSFVNPIALTDALQLYICRHRLHVIQFCLISSNHIGNYFRRCYRRHDLCRFNHPPSCFSGKRKPASQHIVTAWVNKMYYSQKHWMALHSRHGATTKSKVSQLKTRTFYWTAAMQTTRIKKARIEKKYRYGCNEVVPAGCR